MPNDYHVLTVLFIAQLIGALSPGPNTLIILQYAMHERRLGIIAATGIWPVGLSWAVISLAGLGALLALSPRVRIIMYLVCGSYLLWLGYKSLRSAFSHAANKAAPVAMDYSAKAAFRAGFITNITNPKSMAYYAGVFAATDTSTLSLGEQIFAVTMMPTISFAWYCTLTYLVSHLALTQKIDDARHWLNGAAGIVMIGFGIKLLSELVG
jgi:threonine/homoserine/homoserine lactone efflux protein